jgi:hypothetical protein
MSCECIRYTVKRSEHYYFLYMKSIHEKHQPTTFLCKGTNLEKLLHLGKVPEESREELKAQGTNLKPGQEASVMYEHYGSF